MTIKKRTGGWLRQESDDEDEGQQRDSKKERGPRWDERIAQSQRDRETERGRGRH